MIMIIMIMIIMIMIIIIIIMIIVIILDNFDVFVSLPEHPIFLLALQVLNTLYVRSNKIKVGDCCERIATSLSEQRMVEQGQAKNCKRCHDVTPSPSNLEQFECRGDIQTPKKRLKCEVESSENTIQQQEVMTHSKDNLNMTNEGTTGIESVVDHAKEENSNKTFVHDNAPNKEKRRRKRKKKIKEAKEFNIPPLYVISKYVYINRNMYHYLILSM